MVLILKWFFLWKTVEKWFFFMDKIQLPQGYNHFEEAVYFLPLSYQKLLVLIFYQPLKDEQRKYQYLIQRKEHQSLLPR